MSYLNQYHRRHTPTAAASRSSPYFYHYHPTATASRPLPSSLSQDTEPTNKWVELLETVRTPNIHQLGKDVDININITPLPLFTQMSTQHMSSGVGCTPTSFHAQASFEIKGTSLMSTISDEIAEAILAPSPPTDKQHRREGDGLRRGGKRILEDNRDAWERQILFFNKVRGFYYEISSANSNSGSGSKARQKKKTKKTHFPPLLEVAYERTASEESADRVFRDYRGFKKWLSNVKYTFSLTNPARERILKNKEWLHHKLNQNEVLSFIHGHSHSQ